jgi:hypothetical protein
MPTNLLLLPLLAGFWFVTRTHYLNFRTQRLDGYWLLLESSFFGVIFGVLARLFVVAIASSCWGSPLKTAWATLSSIPYTGTAVASFCIGIVAPYLVNGIFLLFGGIERARNLAIERHGTDLDKLLNAALASERKISVTLNNRKWYVGYVSRVPSLSPREAYVSILPVMSGFRNPETLEMEATTDYVPIYESGVDKNKFVVIVPIAAIASASLFDDEIYVRFMSQKHEDNDADVIPDPVVRPDPRQQT